MNNINPITRLDYPDPDVIRVGKTYYMVSTTMYFMPGCEILRSYDLVHWEHATFVYDRLDSTPAQKLAEKENIYGQGMWAASLRYHNDTFYICFVANDTHKTYIYQSKDIYGPWEKYCLEGFYHDNSILFDDDGKIYIIYGNKNIYMKELKFRDPFSQHLWDHDTHSTEKLIIADSDDVYLGYEGSHIYKINGKYVIFLIHMPKTTGRRTESCFIANSPYGPYVGKDVMDDDRNYWGSGVAQGGVVETPSGKWYSILFQDSGAVGRIPVLMPISWDNANKDDSTIFPVFGTNGKIPEEFEIEDLNPGYNYEPLVSSDDFTTDYSKASGPETDKNLSSCFGFKPCWQFNHEPDLALIKRDFEKGTVTVTTDKLCSNLVQAKNTLTQRTLFPRCKAFVSVDASALKDGDYAGLCVLESCYGLIGITKRNSDYYLIMGSREITTGGFWGERHDDEPFEEKECVKLDGSVVTICASVSFDGDDTASFAYMTNDGSMKSLGAPHHLQFKLDHFTGARFGLFVYSTKKEGGSATFSNYRLD
jgi:beta-xylosidase